MDLKAAGMANLGSIPVKNRIANPPRPKAKPTGTPISIINITHNLKKIVLKGSRNNFNLVLVFYKSEILREVGNE